MDGRSLKEKYELFVEISLRIQMESFIQKTKGKVSISHVYDKKTNEYAELFDGFEYNDFRVVLNDVRKFLLNKEPTFLDFIFNSFEKVLINDELLNLTRKARGNIKDFKKKECAIIIEGRKFTNEDIGDLFFNGYYFHSDDVHTRYLKDLPKDFFMDLRILFIFYISEYISLILWICNLILYCFENNLFDFSKEN